MFEATIKQWQEDFEVVFEKISFMTEVASFVKEV